MQGAGKVMFCGLGADCRGTEKGKERGTEPKPICLLFPQPLATGLRCRSLDFPDRLDLRHWQLSLHWAAVLFW